MAFISESGGSAMVKDYTSTSGNQTRSAYFDKAGILDLLDTPGADGLRFYIGKDASGEIVLIGTPEAGGTRLSNSNGVLLYDNKCPLDCVPNPL